MNKLIFSLFVAFVSILAQPGVQPFSNIRTPIVAAPVRTAPTTLDTSRNDQYIVRNHHALATLVDEQVAPNRFRSVYLFTQPSARVAVEAAPNVQDYRRATASRTDEDQRITTRFEYQATKAHLQDEDSVEISPAKVTYQPRISPGVTLQSRPASNGLDPSAPAASIPLADAALLSVRPAPRTSGTSQSIQYIVRNHNALAAPVAEISRLESDAQITPNRFRAAYLFAQPSARVAVEAAPNVQDSRRATASRTDEDRRITTTLESQDTKARLQDEDSVEISPAKVTYQPRTSPGVTLQSRTASNGLDPSAPAASIPVADAAFLSVRPAPRTSGTSQSIQYIVRNYNALATPVAAISRLESDAQIAPRFRSAYLFAQPSARIAVEAAPNVQDSRRATASRTDEDRRIPTRLESQDTKARLQDEDSVEISPTKVIHQLRFSPGVTFQSRTASNGPDHTGQTVPIPVANAAIQSVSPAAATKLAVSAPAYIVSPFASSYAYSNYLRVPVVL